jgi:phage terminase large subunit
MAHLDECTEIDEDSKMQIEQRTSHYMLYSLNPNCMDHFVFDLMQRDASTHLYVHSTYKDNCHLGQVQIDRIESRKPIPENIAAGTANEWYWMVYGEGKRCRREGTVYNNWQIIENDEFPQRNACRIWGYGMDFGYSRDETVLVLCAVFQDALYIDEVFASKELSVLRNEQLPNRDCIQNRLEYHEVPKNVPICSESAEPRTCDELSEIGYNIIKCKDKRIESGIDLVSRFTIYVTRHSQGAIMELENYVRDPKTGEPIDDFNHRMDAIRYFCVEKTAKMAQADPDYEEYKRRLCRVKYKNKLARRR